MDFQLVWIWTLLKINFRGLIWLHPVPQWMDMAHYMVHLHLTHNIKLPSVAMLWLLYKYTKMLGNLWSTSCSHCIPHLSHQHYFCQDHCHQRNICFKTRHCLSTCQVESLKQEECTSLPFHVPVWKAWGRELSSKHPWVESTAGNDNMDYSELVRHNMKYRSWHSGWAAKFGSKELK